MTNMNVLSGKTIFLVEDNAANAGIMLTTLQMAGAKTHFDRWGTHTLKQMENIGKLDLVLMDLMLANGVTGYDVFEAIKAHTMLKSIPVVVVSASDAGLEMGKARDRGFAAYIAKPINFKTFPQIIASIIEGQEYWADDLYS